MRRCRSIRLHNGRPSPVLVTDERLLFGRVFGRPSAGSGFQLVPGLHLGCAEYLVEDVGGGAHEACYQEHTPPGFQRSLIILQEISRHHG